MHEPQEPSQQEPSQQPPEAARLMPARAENARALYVINLSSSNTPMPLEMPDVRGFFGLAVFRSRRLEDGRERFRLHLGYFESRADAERALPAVQRRYPTAWIAAAPRSGLGSLDDTNVSEFHLIHTPAARPAQPDLIAPPPVLSPGEIPVAAPQRYVVQLVWSDQRVDPNQIPQLAIYDAYTMYTVTVMRSGVRYYGIRLGFFTSVISARQIALYVRPDFPAVAVVPVSSREYDVARTIAWHRDARSAMQTEAKPEEAPSGTPVETASPAPAAAAPAAEPPPAAAELVIPKPEAPPSILDPVRIVSAKLVQSTPPVSPEATAVPEPAPIVVPEPPAPAEGTRPGAPEAKSATMKMREEAQRRAPAFSREDLLAALNAIDAPRLDKRGVPHTEPGTRYAPVTVHKRESALKRFWHRLRG